MCSWGRWVMRGGHERRVCSYGTGRCAWIAMDVRMVTTTEYTQERVPDGGRNGVHYLRSETFAFSRGNHQLMEAKVEKAVNVEARFKSLKIYLYWGSRVSGGAGLETLMVNRSEGEGRVWTKGQAIKSSISTCWTFFDPFHITCRRWLYVNEKQ